MVSNVTIGESYRLTSDETESFSEVIFSLLGHFVPRHQMNYNKYLVPLAYAYVVHVYRSVKVSPFRLALRKSVRTQEIFMPKHPLLTSDIDIDSPLYPRLKLTREPKSTQNEIKKKLKLSQKKHKQRHDQNVRPVMITKETDEVYREIQSASLSVSKTFAAKG